MVVPTGNLEGSSKPVFPGLRQSEVGGPVWIAGLSMNCRLNSPAVAIRDNRGARHCAIIHANDIITVDF